MAEAAGLSTGGAGLDTKPDDEHFVDKHQSELIKRVSNVEPILDELLHQNVIQQESYDEIKTLSTAEEKMRELISGPLKSSGVQGKDIFYEILIENQPLLIQDLKRMDAEAQMVNTPEGRSTSDQKVAGSNPGSPGAELSSMSNYP
ncbi:apoptosis-associated speck-like protein containing a CARD [Sparus aurata]|uniref:apoptosis-associated speck-like protein containing a CARD n=1 Tax=Sparus aurata TaxID=8175 RepID=UPI0011C171D6|nr:apoptosis-associated speck-like protein containing a CARD [Sparus aurata]